MKVPNLIRVLLISLGLLVVVYSQCTWLSVLQNSTWLDSDKGTVIFTDTAMSGWTIADGRSGSQIISDWECFFQAEYSSYSIVIYQAVSTVTFLEGTFRVFICMKLTDITSNSFYYYQQSPPDINYYDTERITVKREADVAGISSANAESSLCVSDSVNGPSDNEYHVLVRKGKETDVIQTCDSSFFGRYWYNVTADETKWYCDETSYWDVCSDNALMTFDYAQCSTVIAESSNGEVRCLLTLSTSSYILQTLLTTSNTSHNFTCILSSLDESTGIVKASLAPGSCKKDQTPDTVPEIVHADGSVEKTGQVVQLIPNAEGLCPLTTTTPPTTITTTTPATSVETATIVGGVLGSLAFIALVIILIIACKIWKLGKACLSKEKENDNSGTNTKSSKKCCRCWEDKQSKLDKAKLKEGMVIESLPHKRIPHFIHEQPAMAPNMTALDHEENSVVDKSPKNTILSPRSPKGVHNKRKLRKVHITPVETPDTAGKSSQASMSTVNSTVKSRNLSSVNLSIGKGSDVSPYPMSRNSIVSESPAQLSARSTEKLNESFNSESIGRVSSLSKYLNSTQDTVVNSDVNTLDETVSMSVIADVNLDLKPILPISASESFAFESKRVYNQTGNEQSSSHRTTGIKKGKPDSSSNPISSSKRLKSSASLLHDNKLESSDKVTYKRLSESHTAAATFRHNSRSAQSNVNSKSPSRSINSKNTTSSQWTTVDEQTVTNTSLSSRSRSLNKSSLKRRHHSKTSINSAEPERDVGSQISSSSQWTTIDERTLTSSADVSQSSKSEKPTYKKYRNSNLGRQSKESSRNVNSKQTDSSQWTTMDEETPTNSTVLSKPSTPVSAYPPPHHQNPYSAVKERIGSASSERSNTSSSKSSKPNSKHGILKPTTHDDTQVIKFDQDPNTQAAHVQGTQTDISSLEVYFQAHGYPEQAYPKSVKTSLYYISDSPLTPIAEATEHKTVKQRSKQNDVFDDFENEEPITCMKLYSENTFSSQWETVDEETVTESESTDGSEEPTPVRSKQTTVMHANIVKPIGAADTTIPFQRVRTYNGYEPDSD